MVKLKKKRNNLNSVEAYAICMCAYVSCICGCELYSCDCDNTSSLVSIRARYYDIAFAYNSNNTYVKPPPSENILA